MESVQLMQDIKRVNPDRWIGVVLGGLQSKLEVYSGILVVTL